MHDDSVFSNERALVSMKILASKMGSPEILTVPLYMLDDSQGGSQDCPTYTTVDGIYIAKSVLENEPHNVGGYVAHEILHHVIVDPALTIGYDHDQLNIATDYKINQVLYELWNYDVTKFGIEGLRSKDYDKCSLHKTCDSLFPKGVSGCGVRHVGATHPVILKVAMRLRRMFQDHPKTRHMKLPTPRTITPLPEDRFEVEMFQTMRKRYRSLTFDTELTAVDVDEVIQILWARLYLPEVTYVVGTLRKPVPLSLSETIGVSPVLDPYRERTVLRTDESFMTMRLLLRKIFLFHKVREFLIQNTKRRIDNERAVISRKRRKEFIQRLERRLKRYEQFPILADLTGAENHATFYKKKESLFSKVDLRTDPVPRFKGTALTRAVRFIVRHSEKEFHKAMDTLNKVNSVLGPLTEDEDVQSEGQGDGTPQPGSGLGSPTSLAESKLDNLDLIESNLNLLSGILEHAEDFAEKLSASATNRTDPNYPVDSTYEFSSDLDRVLPSELARLNNPATRLAFFVDLANGALLSHVSTDPRRGPVIFLLDCSGSMMGKRYAMAAGFILAMSKKMLSFGRKTALVKFSHKVDSSTVWGESDPPSMSDLLTILASPSGAGTVYDTALIEALGIHLHYSWSNTTVFLITDGDDKADGSIVSELESSGITLTAVLVSRREQVLGIRKTIVVDPTTMKASLITAGSSLL